MLFLKFHPQEIISLLLSELEEKAEMDHPQIYA